MRRAWVRRTALIVTAVLCLIIWSPACAKKQINTRKKADKSLLERKRMCEKTQCAHLVPLEGQNCINHCISEACYQSTFADEPLEDGEIDDVRTKKFRACARREMRTYSRGKSRTSVSR